MKKFFLLFLLTFLITNSSASIKDNIILNLNNTINLAFNFEQNINGKIETGNCLIEYPKKINCRYNLQNNKILISNGTSLAIKTKNSFYLYPLEKTPLDLILDKKFLLQKINKLDERIINDKFINFNFSQNGNKINIFFDKVSYDLIGWQTVDAYQNLSITYLFSIIKNKELAKNIFRLPEPN